MKQISLSIAYDGPALFDGTMDVDDFAPALLSVGHLFKEANTILNGDKVKFKTSIKATNKGSFEIVLALSQTGWEQVVELFSGESFTAALTIRELIFGSPGLIWLIKKLKGCIFDKIEKKNDSNVLEITIDNQIIDVPEKVYKLYQNAEVRIALKKIIADPLKKDGIDMFKSEYDNHLMTVNEDEAEYIESTPSSDEDIIQSSRQAAFSIHSITFKENNKWRLSDNHSSISASIEDQAFLEKINRNQVSFSKGDTLICELRTTQRISPGGIKTTHVVERVVQHIRAPRQLELDLGVDDMDKSE